MTERNSYLLVLVIAIIAFFTNSEVLAASADAPRQHVAGGGLFIAFGIAYLSRRRPIGGWLLYFYVQLYLSLFISLIVVSQVVSNLDPRQWSNSFLYVMFFLSTFPMLATEFLEIFAATKLLFRRNEQNVKFLRKILIALAITSAMALVIDVKYFQEVLSPVFDSITLVFAIIWFLYFSKARRVKMVFINRTWVYTPYSKRRALSAEDKKKLRNRALISALVTFVLFLLITGFVLRDEGKQPDFGIFTMPIFYAVVAAIVAWFLPVRKRKKKETSTAKDTSIDAILEEHDT